MKIVVLGGGVIGVTSAYYLAKCGHDVTVVERQPAAALETSFANAGEISPGYAAPWAGPTLPTKAIKWLLMRHKPLILRLSLDWDMLCWMASTLRNCTAHRYAINKERMVRLAEFSRDQLIELRSTLGIEYDQRSRGTLQLFRTQKQLDSIGKDVEVLKSEGVPFEILDRAGCVAREPGLRSAADRIVGGLRLPNDETGDCFKFTTALAGHCVSLGVRFLFGTTIEELQVRDRCVTGVRTSSGIIEGDRFVLALGSYSPRIVQPLGLRLRVYPVKGYSISVPIMDYARAPESTLMDETYKVAITRLGSQIRVGGMAELSGFNNYLPPQRRETLEHSLRSLFPGGGDLSRAEYWSGLRPMMPDGGPLIGPTRIRNLFLNTGHGTLGWTMACGSGRVLADLIDGKAPAIDASDLPLARFRSAQANAGAA